MTGEVYASDIPNVCVACVCVCVCLIHRKSVGDGGYGSSIQFDDTITITITQQCKYAQTNVRFGPVAVQFGYAADENHLYRCVSGFLSRFSAVVVVVVVVPLVRYMCNVPACF